MNNSDIAEEREPSGSSPGGLRHTADIVTCCSRVAKKRSVPSTNCRHFLSASRPDQAASAPLRQARSFYAVRICPGPLRHKHPSRTIAPLAIATTCDLQSAQTPRSIQASNVWRVAPSGDPQSRVLKLRFFL
ncbi:similar to titin [Rhodopirellula baltica SH 1]|uniref:Similar to titin n=1 Tax=Rhodopirellula baltica (strain DSM 10527 / NCIMB 13988 / SH1) TaxID=243090 RepID=Q7UM11_RHOBA|nr:similar to titin [Rhodopirellula baltica SH 1]